MTQISSKITIRAPVDAVWQTIGDFGAAGQYLAGVVDCTVAGTGVGARRTLTNVDGSLIEERLETLDEETYRLSYTLLTDTPFGNCRTALVLRDLGSNRTELTWSVSFEANGIPASEAVDLLEGVLASNCLVLKQNMEIGGE